MKKLVATIECKSDETLDDIQNQLKDNVEDLKLEFIDLDDDDSFES